MMMSHLLVLLCRTRRRSPGSSSSVVRATRLHRVGRQFDSALEYIFLPLDAVALFLFGLMSIFALYLFVSTTLTLIAHATVGWTITTTTTTTLSTATAATTTTTRAASTINMAAEADEFGDASFLMDFDVDAVVEQQQQRLKEQQQQQQQQPKHASGTTDTTTSNNNKRRKVLADNNNEIASSSSSSGSNNSNNNKKHKIDNSSCETSSLECTLQKYFGYDTYRDGQKDAIESILYDNKDVAIFWSTGSGKSICYQIPPLHTNRPALVVSPLISLMQDQVTKLNNNIAAGTDTVSIFNGDNNNNKKKIATYLGSGQVDNAMEESRALNCEYLLIYVTAEKLLSHGFLDKLSSKTLDLCVIAIDESHCVRYVT